MLSTMDVKWLDFLLEDIVANLAGNRILLGIHLQVSDPSVGAVLGKHIYSCCRLDTLLASTS